MIIKIELRSILQAAIWGALHYVTPARRHRHRRWKVAQEYASVKQNPAVPPRQTIASIPQDVQMGLGWVVADVVALQLQSL